MQLNLRDEIVREYARTTSARSFQISDDALRRHHRTFLARFGEWLPSALSATCLDLGCGRGEVLWSLGECGYRNLSGVDESAQQIDQAKRYLLPATLVCSNANQYLKRLDAESLDFITAINFLEHLTRDELLGLLREARRVLRPGGSIVAMVPNAASPYACTTRYWDMTHEWAFTPNNFRQLAALTGFDQRPAFRECAPYAHGITSGIRFALWRLIALGIKFRILVETGSLGGAVYTMDMLVRMTVAV